jgi:Tol biopolymer transport system component
MQFDIWVVNADGSGLTQLTTSPGYDGQPTWSRDGAEIAYVHAPVAGQRDICVMNVDGSGKRRVTWNSHADQHPSWSPDGTALAFDSNRSGQVDIYTIGQDGKGLRRITSNSAEDKLPAWSPDGTRFAFASNRSGQYDIYSVGTDGRSLLRLTTDSAADTSPAWSLDGSDITFTSERDPNAVPNVYAMASDGSDVTQLMNDSYPDHSPDWFGPHAAPGTRVWASRVGPGAVSGTAVDVSPNGSRVYVIGQTSSGNQDVGTYCYDAVTGNLLWSADYNGLSGQHDGPVAVKTSPDGTMAYVVVDDSNTSYAVVAYNAATGQLVWVARYLGVSGNPAHPHALAMSPDGTKLFVTGSASTGTNEGDWATVAFATSDGGQLWVQRYHGSNGSPDVAGPADITVSPDGSRVVVTGYDYNGSTGSEEYATVSYASSSGNQQWASTYGTLWGANATGVVISPDGSHVYVTGNNKNAYGNYDYATVSYNAATGVLQWATAYDGPDAQTDHALDVAVSSDGSELFVFGESETTTFWQLATVAYATPDGAQLWVARGGHGDGQLGAMAISPDGARVYVTGQSPDGSSGFFETIAYNATNGNQLWSDTYVGPQMEDVAGGIAVGPWGTRIFVTGASWDDFTTPDTVTVAYQGG